MLILFDNRGVAEQKTKRFFFFFKGLFFFFLLFFLAFFFCFFFSKQKRIYDNARKKSEKQTILLPFAFAFSPSVVPSGINAKSSRALRSARLAVEKENWFSRIAISTTALLAVCIVECFSITPSPMVRRKAALPLDIVVDKANSYLLYKTKKKKKKKKKNTKNQIDVVNNFQKIILEFRISIVKFK